MNINRRTFLKSGIAAAVIPSFFARAAIGGEAGDRVLVLVQLDGGNDGLNTVVPYGDPMYYRARPGIGLGEGTVIKLDEYAGLHPNLDGLRPAWDDGNLAVVQGVGYPNPNRSHFRSSDIWHTALANPKRWTGWVGRALDRLGSGDVPGLYLDPGPLSLALVGESVVVPSISSADGFRVRGGRRELLDLAIKGARNDATAEYIRKSAVQSYKTAGRVEAALSGGRGSQDYPQSALARRLWQIARMIEAGMPSRVYAVRLTGFDTHARQRGAHDVLMRQLGDALGAFYKDLKAHKQDKRVVTMTYSEFGRRVYENRSLGTDHGAAAPLFVVGAPVDGGLKGKHPSLTDLGDGDLRFHTDFRQVYATVLDRWLNVDSKDVLGTAYKPVPFL